MIDECSGYGMDHALITEDANRVPIQDSDESLGWVHMPTCSLFVYDGPHSYKTTCSPPQICLVDGKKKKKKKKSDYVQVKTEEESVTMVTGIDTMATEDQLEIEKLLKQKKQELEGQGQGNEGKLEVNYSC